MPQEAYCPTCKCTVMQTQQGTCPLGHPLDESAQPPEAADEPAAPYGAPAPAPQTESTLPPPEESDFLAGADAPADDADPLASPPTEGTEMAASAGDPKSRKVSPALIVVLLIVLLLAGAAAAVVLFAPGLVGLAFVGLSLV